MILLPAIVAGLLAVWLRSRLTRTPVSPPALRMTGLVIVAFLPQWLAFYLPVTRRLTSVQLAATVLIGSQCLLLVFAWLNRHQAGFWVLGIGLLLNFIVIAANGGLMPIAPHLIAETLPNLPATAWETGARLGWNIILPAADTRLRMLADTLLTPAWLPYRKALSPGDVLISLGAFWVLWSMGGRTSLQEAA